jgi:two-component system OmpR family sensor kinase
MMAHWSLSRRLIAVLTAGLAALWLAAAGAAALVVHHEINEMFDSTLQEAAQRLLPLAVHDLRGQRQAEHGDHDDDDGDDDDHAIADTLAIEEHDEYLIYQVRDAAGAVLLRSHDAPRQAFPIPLRRGYADAVGWRYYTEAYGRGGLYLQVAEPLAHRWETIAESLVWLAAPLLLLLPLAGVMILLTVRRAMKPIGAIGTAIGARGGADLSPIPGGDLPSELTPIVEDVNHLLARLDKALSGERAFAANSAHELRTPVAAALAQTQRLAVELRGTAHGERIGHIAHTLHRLGDLVEKLLQLSRAEAGVAMSREPTDVMPALTLLIDEFSRRAGMADRIRFADGGRPALILHMDMDAFAIVMRNLIDNALTHGPEGGAVDIAVDDGGAIHVVNGGPVVPPQRLAQLTRRFERGAGATPGSGLGLAIAETIMAQAGGALELHSPATGRNDGFEAIVSFPR